MIQIAIVQRGWVFIGDITRDGDEVVIRRAKSIRRWGTSRGIGELKDGPLANTVLDEVGVFRCHPLQVVGRVDVNPESWENHLG